MTNNCWFVVEKKIVAIDGEQRQGFSRKPEQVRPTMATVMFMKSFVIVGRRVGFINRQRDVINGTEGTVRMATMTTPGPSDAGHYGAH